jgi:HAD superfamily hydrolase (TIGR01509 family)
VTWAAVLFDLDGTLIDTEAIALAAGLDAFAALGFPPDAGLLHRLVGKDHRSGEAILRAALPGLDIAAFDAAWTAAAARRRAAGVPQKPGAAALLAALVLPWGIVTSSQAPVARAKIAAAGLSLPPVLVTFDDVARPKPAPDPYLLAATRLAVDPVRCLVFEDSDTGAQAAALAGMTVVQVPDLLPTTGVFAAHVAADLAAGARWAGLAAA